MARVDHWEALRNRVTPSFYSFTGAVEVTWHHFAVCSSFYGTQPKYECTFLRYTTVMQVLDTPLHDVKLLQPQRYGDSRGWFVEVFNQSTFAAAGLPSQFIQDNQSFSTKGVLRGLHYQLGQPQGKLVRVLSGHIWDVAVDLRQDSPDFGKWTGFDLKAPSADEDLQLLWIPEGFAHGFLVMSDTAEVLYKTTNLYYPAGERSILWNDPTLNIAWPLEALNGTPPAVSAKDAVAKLFTEADLPPVS
jgi:dTDP-4-dehydrorhamnose 3,5-epimerase